MDLLALALLASMACPRCLRPMAVKSGMRPAVLLVGMGMLRPGVWTKTAIRLLRRNQYRGEVRYWGLLRKVLLAVDWQKPADNFSSLV